MADPNRTVIEDPQFVQGQIDGLFALLLAVAELSGAEQFRACALHHLEMARTALLDSPASELRLHAIDQIERRFLAVAPA